MCRSWNLKLKWEQELSQRNNIGDSHYGYQEKMVIGFNDERNNIQILDIMPIALGILLKCQMPKGFTLKEGSLVIFRRC